MSNKFQINVPNIVPEINISSIVSGAVNIPPQISAGLNRFKYVGLIPQDNEVGSAGVLSKEIYSSLGTPMVDQLIINPNGTGLTYYDINNSSNPIKFGTFHIDTCLITVRQSKNIVKTKLQGRDGTVKTYMGLDDYDITIDGIITSDYDTSGGGNGIWPGSSVEDLINICNYPIAIEVSSAYLTHFNIKNLIIMSYDFPQIEGGYSEQTFTLRCISDDIQNTNNTIYSPYININNK